MWRVLLICGWCGVFSGALNYMAVMVQAVAFGLNVPVDNVPPGSIQFFGGLILIGLVDVGARRKTDP